jgi:hypothetical protein
MSLGVIAAIAGGLGAGATFVASDCKVTKKDAFRYLLSGFIVVISVFMVYLARKQTLTVRTSIVGWTAVMILFALLAVQLKNAEEGTPEFTRAITILSGIMSAVSAFCVVVMLWAQHRVHADPFATVGQVLAQVEMMEASHKKH